MHPGFLREPGDLHQYQSPLVSFSPGDSLPESHSVKIGALLRACEGVRVMRGQLWPQAEMNILGLHRLGL